MGYNGSENVERNGQRCLLAALGVVAAAGGGDDAGSAAAPEVDAVAVDDSGADTSEDGSDPATDQTEEQESSEDEGSDTAGVGTLAIDGGPTYTFEMTGSCDTSDTSDSFLVDPGYDAFGRSPDGFTLQLIRAAFEESPDLHPLVAFEGGFDEEGKNNQITYLLDDENYDIQIDGGRIFGQATLEDFFSTDTIHGEAFTATIEINC